MQFITDGPEIPDTLLQAHEEGRVVFFCGAGISYPAGLPGFRGLVDKIYHDVGTVPTAIEQQAYKREQYDGALDLLERRLPGQRITVRRSLAKALKPNLRLKGASATHAALLELSETRDGAIRLVTTNFDQIFETVKKRKKLSVPAFCAPFLPIPKNSRWSGIVYLHGLLPRNDDIDALQRLIVTSGDFGLAYLTERWASRFVSELFRNYVVCFVGYRINDPVLRYMMDALAADRMLGESTLQAYAFGDFTSGNEDEKKTEWEAKGVTPILYEAPFGTHDHSRLHQTLGEWASTYRDGILGKERIVVDYALTRPSDSTKQDDYVGRMLWALSDPSGLPAKRFAEFDPAPALEWLDAFLNERYRHSDLVRFGIAPNFNEDRKLQFSIAERPSPYLLGPWMSLVSGYRSRLHWDEVMSQLGRWLARHLNDPNLLLTLSARGGRLHERLRNIIDDHLTHVARLEREGKTKEIDDLKAKSPNSIPGPFMSLLWRMFLTGSIKSPWLELDLYQWKGLLNRDGLTFSVRREFRRLLAPKISIKKPFRWPLGDESVSEDSDKRPLDWQLSLSGDHARSAIQEFTDDSKSSRMLPDLFDDIERLLMDTLDLSAELQGANDEEDNSSWHLPSIKPHWQNRGFEDWVLLVELLRDAWLGTNLNDPIRAGQLAREWFSYPYPAFKRLALYAATQNFTLRPNIWVGWLTQDRGWWLWSIHTKREVMRLLVEQGERLTPAMSKRLEGAIVQGPPRRMYKDDIDPADWTSIVAREVWLRLAKLEDGRGALEERGAVRLDELSEANPDWKLAANERDEFWHWMSGTGDPDFEDHREFDVAPNQKTALVEWLKKPTQPRTARYEDNWAETCRARFYLTFSALRTLANEGLWPADRWASALQAWSDPSQGARSWRVAAPIVVTMPQQTFEKVGRSAAWWLQEAAKSLQTHGDLFLRLSERVLLLEWELEEDEQDSVFKAINHPIGLVTQGLLDVWFARQPNDNDGLPVDLEPVFTRLTDASVAQYRHGRVVLASRAISLFRVDQRWAEAHLLPTFSWADNLGEAKAAWQGFLWSPRLHWPLLLALKSDLFTTAQHYESLGDSGSQYSAFLTIAALEPAQGFEKADFAVAVARLPEGGLREVAQTLTQSLEGAGDRKGSYWTNRIRPFWMEIWPKSRDLVSGSISESLARLIITADDEFVDALATISPWLVPIEYPHYIIHLLESKKLAMRFPREVLELLSQVNGENAFPSKDMRSILNDILSVEPDLRNDNRLLEFDAQLRRANL